MEFVPFLAFLSAYIPKNALSLNENL